MAASWLALPAAVASTTSSSRERVFATAPRVLNHRGLGPRRKTLGGDASGRPCDDEVRYFVEGSGAFYLHAGERVLQVIGEAGDLLSAPKGATHLFDGGESADFTCIRVFTSPEGWAANYTGAAIAEQFPLYERAAGAGP